MKKYELTDDTITVEGRTLHRIKALKSFSNVEEGELGGYVEKEDNLDQRGDAWVYGDARVSGDAQVSGDARMYGNAQVSGDAWVYGNAQVSGDAWVYGDARVSGDAWVYGDARVSGDAQVSGDAWVYGDAQVSGDAWVYGDARVSGNARVSGENDYTTAKGFGREYRPTTFFRLKDGGIGVQCGCFYGTLDEFRAKVKETHKESKMGKEYLMLADLMEYKFKDA